MSTPAELKRKFFKALASDKTMMLGLVGLEDSNARPMTAQIEGEEGPIWFFSSTESNLVKQLAESDIGFATFVSKNQDLYASVNGLLVLDNNKSMIDALWNPFVAAWYEGGKDDPKLALLRFDLDNGEIWLDGSSIIAGIKMLLGADPKQEYKANVAEVNFGHTS